MAKDGRKSDVACPICGHLLLQPCSAMDAHDWDCYGCNLEMPSSVLVDGRTLIELARSAADPRQALNEILGILRQ